MQKKYLVVLLSFVFVLGFSVDAEAQSRKKKKKGKQRPPKTEQVEEEAGSSERSQRSSRDSSDDKRDMSFSTDKLVYDILGDFRIASGGNVTVLKFGLKPAVSYKVWPRVMFGVAPKIEYYFYNIERADDLHEWDLGLETFGRVLVFESIYLQAGYEFNNAIFNFNQRTWSNTPVIGGGYMSGFGDWRYGAQALLNLNEQRRDDYGVLQFWFGVTYNL